MNWGEGGGGAQGGKGKTICKRKKQNKQEGSISQCFIFTSGHTKVILDTYKTEKEGEKRYTCTCDYYYKHCTHTWS